MPMCLKTVDLLMKESINAVMLFSSKNIMLFLLAINISADRYIFAQVLF